MSRKYLARRQQTLVGNDIQQERLQGHVVAAVAVAVIPPVGGHACDIGLAWRADEEKEHRWRDEGSEFVD